MLGEPAYKKVVHTIEKIKNLFY